MTIIRILLLLTAFATALLAGYKVGENLESVDEILNSKADAIIMPGVTIPENNQFNLLLIGVDDIDQPDASLESVWLAAHVENSPKITLIPVFPSPDDPAQNLLLTESFYIDEGKPSKEFWDAMRNTNIWWKGYLISDLAASIKLIDILGGVGINNQQMNGIQAVSSITPWKDDALVAVNHQKIFLESICNRIATNQIPNLKDISEILDHKFRSNTQTKVFIARWITQAVSNEKLTCAFPTMTQTSLQSWTVGP
jgi:anionic cell wall polymer biosynthesis LytR-Cps2A-Psr (LCP) family protein